MHQTIDLIAVLVTLLLTGSELAIGVFVHPVLSKLQDAAHAEVAKPLARLLGHAVWVRGRIALRRHFVAHSRKRQLVLVGMFIVRGFTCRYCTILAHLSGPH